MKYTEIDEWIYGGREKRNVSDLVPEDRLPWQIIKYLNSLGGFDHWWDDIDKDTQDEIFDGLRAVLNKEA